MSGQARDQLTEQWRASASQALIGAMSQDLSEDLDELRAKALAEVMRARNPLELASRLLGHLL